jgi:hypothetical protein
MATTIPIWALTRIEFESPGFVPLLPARWSTSRPYHIRENPRGGNSTLSEEVNEVRKMIKIGERRNIATSAT